MTDSDPSPKTTKSMPMDGIARRQLHILFILDVSGSMSGDRIASLNYAIRTAIPELRKIAGETPEVDMFVRCLAFGSQASWHVEQPTAPSELVWKDLSCEGETNLGLALYYAAEALDPDTLDGRQLPPVLILVTDGLPTDDYTGSLALIEQNELIASGTRIAVGVGSDVDERVLVDFIANPSIAPLTAHNASELVDQISWAASEPVRSASSAIGGDAQFAVPPPASRDAQAASDIIW